MVQCPQELLYLCLPILSSSHFLALFSLLLIIWKGRVERDGSRTPGIRPSRTMDSIRNCSGEHIVRKEYGSEEVHSKHLHCSDILGVMMYIGGFICSPFVLLSMLCLGLGKSLSATGSLFSLPLTIKLQCPTESLFCQYNKLAGFVQALDNGSVFLQFVVAFSSRVETDIASCPLICHASSP